MVKLGDAAPHLTAIELVVDEVSISQSNAFQDNRQ